MFFCTRTPRNERAREQESEEESTRERERERERERARERYFSLDTGLCNTHLRCSTTGEGGLSIAVTYLLLQC